MLKSRSILQRFNFEALYNTFLGMEPRQQVIAFAAAGLGLLALIILPISLMGSKLGGLEADLQGVQKKERQIMAALTEYRKVKGEFDAIRSKIEKGFDPQLIRTVDEIASKSGIKNLIDRIDEKGAAAQPHYDEVQVEVRMKKVGLSQLVDFLYNLEQHPTLFLRVKEMRIQKRFDNPKLFDVNNLLISTYRYRGEST